MGIERLGRGPGRASAGYFSTMPGERRQDEARLGREAGPAGERPRPPRLVRRFVTASTRDRTLVLRVVAFRERVHGDPPRRSRGFEQDTVDRAPAPISSTEPNAGRGRARGRSACAIRPSSVTTDPMFLLVGPRRGARLARSRPSAPRRSACAACWKCSRPAPAFHQLLRIRFAGTRQGFETP